METRTAPRWIRDLEKRYARMRWVWMCATGLAFLSFVATVVLAYVPGPSFTLGEALGGVTLLFTISIAFLRPDLLAERYGVAVNALDAAIARYEVSPDRPESTLNAAAQWAREYLRIKRIRTAPRRIRRNRRRLTLRVSAWFTPAVLALALCLASSAFRWRWADHWHVPLFMTALGFGAMLGTRGLLQAQQILDEAIQRYEFESAAGDEAALVEADQRASALLEKTAPHSS